jgi:chemotaxis protein CheD
MNIQELKNGTKYTLSPGEYHVLNEDAVLSTLLGSCVSACLYDPVQEVVGMNHFLLSSSRYSKKENITKSEAGRYGIHSMELLINEMLKKGAKRSNLHAKAFGGASIISNHNADNFFCVGEVNVRFVLEFLRNENIPLVTSDLGGTHGRIIHFFHNEYTVYMKKIKNAESQKLGDRDKTYWKKSIKEEEKETESNVDLW